MTIALQTSLLTLDVPEKGAAKGHARITSVSSSPEDIALLGFCASILSNVLYEKMQAGGTSIVISITKDDVRADILARHEEDGVDLQWEFKPGDPAQLDAVQERIRAKTFFIKNDPSAKTHAVATTSANVTGTATPSTVAGPSSTGASEPLGHSVVTASGSERGSERHSVPTSSAAASDTQGEHAVAHGSADDEDDEQDDYLVKQLHRIP